MSSLYGEEGNKQFDSVIVVTDRTVLDDQLQDTIYQFEHQDGVVARINRNEGEGAKSEKLAMALETSQPIIIVTIQTFPYVLKAIENSVSLKARHYAIIADEAHSSQTGTTARQLKEVLMTDVREDDEEELTSEDILDAAVASRRASSNLSYFAFTATPKTRTLELFGRLPDPAEPPSSTNKPEAFHVYSMRQAIEEGFILDVLKNYTNYKVAYNLALKVQASDREVESKKAKIKLNQWMRLHDYNIAQKVQVIIEHFKDNVMGLLGGVECVQTLSRLNRIYPGKAQSGTFVLDFFNQPEDILAAFRPYYQTAELADVSDPDLIFDLFDKLRAAGIFLWQEVEQFCQAFFQKNKSNAAIANICKPAVERWQKRYQSASEAYRQARDMFERSKKTGDAVLIANAENSFKECKQEKDALEIFKKDLGSFVRFYEFMSQIVDYDSKDLEKLSLYAKNLRPMLREVSVDDDDDVDLSNVVLSHYRLSRIRQQALQIKENSGEYGLKPGDELGTAKPKDKHEEFLSRIISRLNELFVTDHLTEKDLVNYAYTIRDKVSENAAVMSQIANNTPEQAMLGDFPKAIDDAIMDSNDAHQNQMMQLLSNPAKAAGFAKVVFDLLKLTK